MNELATLMWKPTSHVALIHSHLRILSFGSHVPIQSLQECEFQPHKVGHIQPQPCYRSFFGPGCTMSWGRMMVVQLYSSLGTHEIPPGKKVETLFNSWVHTWENRKSLKTYIEHGKKTQDLGYLGVQKRTMEVAVWVDWTCKNGQFHRQQTCGLKQQKIDDLCPWEIPTAKRWTLSRW